MAKILELTPRRAKHSSGASTPRRCGPRDHRTQRAQRRAGQAVGRPTITNDGVTIAREIEVTDLYENLGVQLVKEVATKTNDVAGDGTTTATVLAQAMVAEGVRLVVAGASPMGVKRGIDAPLRRFRRSSLWRCRQAGRGHAGDRAGRDHLRAGRRDGPSSPTLSTRWARTG